MRLKVRGAVQGVGFRPFVFRLAHELGVRGFVINDTRGLLLEAEGARDVLVRLQERVEKERPPLAVVSEVDSAWIDPIGDEQFEIRDSDAAGDKRVFVLPDIATCDACRSEIGDPSNRRHGYPFTNCTACGPRFSIVRTLPYDRPNTTMAGFALCERCAAEYADPLDRRFHAQPNACAACGPHVWLANPDGNRVAEPADALDRARVALREGRILALKGVGGFQLLVDATNQAAVTRLRERKHRWEKPLALMVGNVSRAAELCEVSSAASELLTSPAAPIVLLPRHPAAPVADAVAPGNPYLGVMLPYSPLHHLLLGALDVAVVATSGNLSDEPICIDNDEALQRLHEIADVFLLHDRPIERHVDDSVAVLHGDSPQLFRRARGYAPLPVSVPTDLPDVLAVGPHLKNTVALGLGREVFISQHIGDLATPEAIGAHARVIHDLLRLYAARPAVIAHDLHPDYASTRVALQLAEAEPSAQLVPVQHHHAHLAACLADNRVEGPALGVTWDGVGLGPDGTIWGGEFLLGDARGCERVAHLRPFRLPGGDRVSREPRRSALGLLHELGSTADPAAGFGPDELAVLSGMLARQVNCPVTTSAGRLFDAVASLAGIRQTVSFEGQAAMELEYAADVSVEGSYEIAVQGQPLVLDWGPMVEQVRRDVRDGVPTPCIAIKFHRALARAVVGVALRIKAPRVALSGGCFQNRLLTELTLNELRQAGFDVLLHRQVPPNDGCISLGQAVIAAAQTR